MAKPPLAWASESLVGNFDSEDKVPQKCKDAGCVYALGCEDIKNQLEFLNKRIDKKWGVEFVIHYAMLDAQPAWIGDILDGD